MKARSCRSFYFFDDILKNNLFTHYFYNLILAEKAQIG